MPLGALVSVGTVYFECTDIFSGIAEIPGENPEAVVRTFLKRDMKIRRSIDFERVHRIGRVERDRIRPIVAKFSSYKDREAVRGAAPGALKDTSFGVNKQFPKEINDRRKVLYPHFKAAKRAGHRVSLNVDRLYHCRVTATATFCLDVESVCKQTEGNPI